MKEERKYKQQLSNKNTNTITVTLYALKEWTTRKHKRYLKPDFYHGYTCDAVFSLKQLLYSEFLEVNLKAKGIILSILLQILHKVYVAHHHEVNV